MLVNPENYEGLRLWLGRMVVLVMPDIEVGSDIDPVRVLDGFAKTAPAKARQDLLWRCQVKATIGAVS